MEDLGTARLVLHPLTAAEARRLLTRKPGAGDRWGPGYPTDGDLAGARRFLRVWDATGDPGAFCCYEIRHRAGGEAIGGLDFHGPVDDEGAVTIGYGLIPSARGHGYAAEALRALLALARAHGATRVLGDADASNVASQRVMAAAGMHQVAATGQLTFYAVSWPEP
jgi:RimJ/RimL family protein N-acetyltransferase